MQLGAFSAVAFSAAFVLLACASKPEAEPVGDTDNALSGGALHGATTRTNLLYEGTCAFLHQCSSYSRKLSGNGVEWGCGGSHTCSDSALWVAGPTRSHCNKSVKLCVGSTCTTAVVRDISISQSWEASNGVLDALGLSHAVIGKCQGSGGGSVSVTYPATPTEVASAGDDDDGAFGAADSTGGTELADNTDVPTGPLDPSGSSGSANDDDDDDDDSTSGNVMTASVRLRLGK